MVQNHGSEPNDTLLQFQFKFVFENTVMCLFCSYKVFIMSSGSHGSRKMAKAKTAVRNNFQMEIMSASLVNILKKIVFS